MLALLELLARYHYVEPLPDLPPAPKGPEKGEEPLKVLSAAISPAAEVGRK